ncbi:glycolipid 2-alpha-mannosyltransferase-domain-containing protein [Hypoxylon cercidicola]|nr:glycolipid 2-alpha-mannosyltransferase-domain-containing protein [Hypoxylon cercidicola]
MLEPLSTRKGQMELDMAGPYPRHPVGMDAQGVSRPRPGAGQGHSKSWSGSSVDDLLSPLTMTSRQEEQVDAVPTDPVANATDPPRSGVRRVGWMFLPRRVRLFSLCKILLLCLVFALCRSAWFLYKVPNNVSGETNLIDSYTPPLPETFAGHTVQGERIDPIQWLRQNTIPAPHKLLAHEMQALAESRPKAAFISLVRNEELEDMVASILQVESRFNGRDTHQYDWVFFNSEDFTEEFQAAISNSTSSRCYFERIPKEHWSIPSWVDETRFDVGRQGKAWLQSDHHMCRWNAGIFALEERLADYDWYWRVESAVKFHCDINYDVFRFMQDNNMAYGFNKAILDDARSFPSLWEQTKAFIEQNGDLVDNDADFNWLLHTADDQDDVIRPHTGAEEKLSDGEYNNCQFYSNFEIGSPDFFRSKKHRAYFNHLDQAGGFYYERLGDAPVHTLSVSLFLPKDRLWYFRDIGHAHGLCEQCPPREQQSDEAFDSHANEPLPRDTEEEAGTAPLGTRSVVVGPFETLGIQHRRWKTMAQDVERQKGIPGLSCGCTVSAIDSNNARLVPYESKQRKPSDPCILTQRLLQAVMVLSTFWMAEMVSPSSRCTFLRAVLLTIGILIPLWGIPWIFGELSRIFGHKDEKLYFVTPIHVE